MNKSKPFIINTVFIVIGAFLLAVGINCFFVPSKICSGGVSSIGTILYYKFGVHLSVTNTLANLVLLVLGFKLLGKEAVLKSIIGVAALSVALEITSYLPTYTESEILATVVGGVVAGLGMGIIVKRMASTGGTDFIALILKRFIPHASLAGLILVLDCSIIIISGFVFESFTITIYSIIAMYLCSRVTDAVVSFGSKAKAVQIFSDNYEWRYGYLRKGYVFGQRQDNAAMRGQSQGIAPRRPRRQKDRPLGVYHYQRCQRGAGRGI